MIISYIINQSLPKFAWHTDQAQVSADLQTMVKFNESLRISEEEDLKLERSMNDQAMQH